MKKSFFLPLSFLILIASFLSCTKEQASIAKTELISASDHEAYLKQLEKDIIASGKKYRIEAATLEELNAALRAAGMDEISEEEVQRAKSMVHPRTTWMCETWVALGDWDGDNVLDVNDVVDARNNLCDIDYCYVSVNINSCTTNCPDDPGYNFAFLSGLHTDDNWWDFGDSDMTAANYRIL